MPSTFWMQAVRASRGKALPSGSGTVGVMPESRGKGRLNLEDNLASLLISLFPTVLCGLLGSHRQFGKSGVGQVADHAPVSAGKCHELCRLEQEPLMVAIRACRRKGVKTDFAGLVVSLFLLFFVCVGGFMDAIGPLLAATEPTQARFADGQTTRVVRVLAASSGWRVSTGPVLHHCAACLGKILGSLPARPEESLRRAWRLLDENRKGHIDLEVRVGMSWTKQRVISEHNE